MNALIVDIRNAVPDDLARSCQFIPGPLRLNGLPLASLG